VIYPAVGLVLAYLLGSVPAALIAGKLVGGIDLREHGSGNLGATNVLRTLGARVAAPVLLFDALKGAVPVLLFPKLFATGTSDLWAIGYGLAAIAGHVRPVYLKGKGGGKGVATTAGVVAALAPLPFAIALGVFSLVVAATRYVSLGSIVAAAVLPFAMLIGRSIESPLVGMSAFIAGFVLWTHRANVGRLMRGEEARVGSRPRGA
jgi:acyl phosphate:glycerol-3-phosphate acyltransferase